MIKRNRVVVVLVACVLAVATLCAQQFGDLFARRLCLGSALSTCNTIRQGAGSPEASITGIVGDLYLRTNGADGTVFYVKESGSGNTGWVAYASPASTSSVFRKATVTQTNAQIKTWPTGDVTLVAAPGAGHRILLISTDLQIDTSAGAYTNISADAWSTVTISLTAGYYDQSGYLANDSGYPTSALTLLSGVFGSTGKHQATFAPLWRPDPPLSPAAVGGGGWQSLVNTTAVYDQAENKALVFHFDNAAAGALTGGNAANSAVLTTLYVIK